MTSKPQPEDTSADVSTNNQLLETIGDESARRILAAITREPRSAEELSETLDLSVPTVSRRLGMLEASGLIARTSHIVTDGNNYDKFEPAFEALIISLTDETFEVQLYRPPDSDASSETDERKESSNRD